LSSASEYQGLNYCNATSEGLGILVTLLECARQVQWVSRHMNHVDPNHRVVTDDWFQVVVDFPLQTVL